ncbi:MAG: hypothetical protein KatS3mg054_0053 [Chloroflexus sp.]|nr:MAG: hypothetical protein KatS3mg054_0053 [Chloroflexus sp.]
MRIKAIDGKGDPLVDELRPEPDYTRGVYVLGLEQMVPNPYKGTSPEELVMRYQLDQSKWGSYLDVISKAESVPYQTVAEVHFSLPYGYLSPRRLGLRERKGERTYWQRVSVKVTDYPTNIYDTSTLEGWSAVVVLAHSRYVATSRESVNTSIHRWLLEEQHVSVAMELRTIEMTNKAIRVLSEMMDTYPNNAAMEDNVFYQVAVAMTLDDHSFSVPRTSGSSVIAALDGYLKPMDSAKAQQRARLFLEVVDLMKKDSMRFIARYIAAAMRLAGAIQLANGRVYWLAQKNRNNSAYEFTKLASFEDFVHKELTAAVPTYYDDLMQDMKNRKVIVPSSLISVS